VRRQFDLFFLAVQILLRSSIGVCGFFWNGPLSDIKIRGEAEYL
jgi:hypothetical protein